MWTEELQLLNMKLVNQKNLWHRVIALDFETRIEEKSEFLTNENILGISVARRNTTDTIERKNIILEEENLECEIELLKHLSNLFEDWKPLLIVGYGLKFYDQPLLAIKQQKCKNNDVPVWGINNVINGSIFIELSDLSSYLFYKKYNEKRSRRKMSAVLNHKHFYDLPFIRTKELYNSTFEDKGKRIYEDWKLRDKRFIDYLDGEAHNQLLIAERIRDTEIMVV